MAWEARHAKRLRTKLAPNVRSPNVCGTNVTAKLTFFGLHISKTFRCKTLNVNCVANVWQRSPFHQTFCTHEALCVCALDRM
jgi:hypothetical protein